MQQRPVSKESWIARGNLARPMLGSPSMPSQAFVFRHRPVRKAPVEVAQRGIKCRLIVTTVVVDPAPYDGVEHPCQVVDPLVRATTQPPVTDFLPDRFRRRVADTGAEGDEELSPTVLRSPG